MEEGRKKILWSGVECVGTRVNEEAWYCGKYQYNNGYHAIRTVVYNEDSFTVSCKIYRSITGSPLFECYAKDAENGDFKAQALGTTTTTAVRNLFQKLCLKLNFNHSYKKKTSLEAGPFSYCFRLRT